MVVRLPTAVPGGPPAPPPRDGLAIAATVLAVLGLVVLAVPFAIAALVRGSGGRRSGQGFAVAGLVLSGLWVCPSPAAADPTPSGSAAATGTGTTASPTAPGPTVKPRRVAVERLRPGQCPLLRDQPRQGDLDHGDRGVICLVLSPDGMVSSPMKGSRT